MRRVASLGWRRARASVLLPFQQGFWVSWTVKGRVTIALKKVTGANAGPSASSSGDSTPTVHGGTPP
ncbi:hypothetical protein OG894_05385 [Streptomyces sp. NBC_01724]|uniref:hypothetical protein n=1 Tax=unclassified Streptomyces TaxID=2593676 RepID=UPI002E3815B9|nr:hypothetical protein [Streptomyces sp. NBC_01724]WTE55903.1 hypothetical protein OG987_37335 [Streptomyces sp. NBC_01620]